MGKPSIWSTGFFDVPVNYTQDDVLRVAPKYMKRFGEYLEMQGYQVVQMLKPVPAMEISNTLFGQPDSRRYTIFAQVTRKPVDILVEVPDDKVSEMEKVGLTLKE